LRKAVFAALCLTYDTGMFFVLLCILLWALFAFNAPFDRFGWLMLVAAAWMAGFLDARFFAKREGNRELSLPPDVLREQQAGEFE
jgi:hypothetical protein